MLKKAFTNHFGLDLKSSDINRRDEFASGMTNAQYRKDGNIEKRPGYRAKASSQGGHGLFNYTPVNGNEELLAVSDKVSKLTETTFTISYSGSDPTAIVSIFVDPENNTYKCQIQEDTNIVLDTDLGVGFDEASPKDLAALKSEIDALTNFSATISGTTTIPAAFLDLLRDHDLVDSDATITAREWVDVNSVLSAPFAGSETNKNSDDFENVSAIQLNYVLYMSNGYDEVQKYDGQNVYRAGVPRPDSAPSLVAVSGGTLNGTYRYKYSYIQRDNIGNIVEGDLSDVSPDQTASSEDFDVTVDNIQSGSGFNTNAAIVDGAQSGVNTITVDNGSGGSHTFNVGDTAYFLDSSSGEYVTRNISSTTSTSITIDGAAVDVADNAVISNNLRISVKRNKNGGTFLFTVAEIPNDPFNSTQTFRDDTTDANLGLVHVPFLTNHEPPPKGKYLAKYNNQLFVMGDPDNPNFAYWSSVFNPEFFDTTRLFERFQSKNGEPISGGHQDGEFMAIFEPRATHIISGDIPSNNIRIDTLSEDIGCVAHATIQEVRGSLFWLSDRGPWTKKPGAKPEEVSQAIEPVFDNQEIKLETEKLTLKRAVAINDRENQKYIVFVPTESKDGSGNVYVNDNMRIFALDYFRGAWLEWNNMNMAGGVITHKSQLYWVERRFSDFNSTVDHILYCQMQRGDNWDHADNTQGTPWEYDTAWYAFGEPSVFKTFLWLKLFTLKPLVQTEILDFFVDATIETDYIDDVEKGPVNFDLTGIGAGYGLSEYGEAAYGGVRDPGLLKKIGPIKAKSLRFKFTNNEPLQNVILTGWEISFQAPYRQEMKE